MEVGDNANLNEEVLAKQPGHATAATASTVLTNQETTPQTPAKETETHAGKGTKRKRGANGEIVEGKEEEAEEGTEEDVVMEAYLQEVEAERRQAEEEERFREIRGRREKGRSKFKKLLKNIAADIAPPPAACALYTIGFYEANKMRSVVQKYIPNELVNLKKLLKTIAPTTSLPKRTSPCCLCRQIDWLTPPLRSQQDEVAVQKYIPNELEASVKTTSNGIVVRGPKENIRQIMKYVFDNRAAIAKESNKSFKWKPLADAYYFILRIQGIPETASPEHSCMILESLELDTTGLVHIWREQEPISQEASNFINKDVIKLCYEAISPEALMWMKDPPPKVLAAEGTLVIQWSMPRFYEGVLGAPQWCDQCQADHYAHHRCAPKEMSEPMSVEQMTSLYQIAPRETTYVEVNLPPKPKQSSGPGRAWGK